MGSGIDQIGPPTLWTRPGSGPDTPSVGRTWTLANSRGGVENDRWTAVGVAGLPTGHYSDSDLELDLRWWAAGQLSDGRADLPAGQRAAARAARPSTSSPGCSGTGAPAPVCRCSTPCSTGSSGGPAPTSLRDRSRTRRARAGRRHVPGGHLQRGVSRRRPATPPASTALFRQFSTPGGIPSHVSVQTPGSIHEGGELGYALVHAAGAAFDHPDLLVACVIGDGEAETGPLSGSWKLPAFLNPAATAPCCRSCTSTATRSPGPPCWAGPPTRRSGAYLASQGWAPVVVSGDDPRLVFTDLHAALPPRTPGSPRSSATRGRAAQRGPVAGDRAAHPEGLDRPARRSTACWSRARTARTRFRCRACRTTTRTWPLLETWLRSLRPDHLFDADGPLAPELAGARAGGRPPDGLHAVRQRRPAPRAARIPALAALRPRRPRRPGPRRTRRPIRSANCSRRLRATRPADGGGDFRLFCPDETASNRLQSVFEVTDRCLQLPVTDYDDGLSPHGRVMEVLSEHLCEGWLEGYLLSGRHGLFATYEAFAMVSASMAGPAREVAAARGRSAVAGAGALAERPADQHLLAQRPQRVQPSGPRPDRRRLPLSPARRPDLAAAGRQLPAVDRRPLPAQPRPRQPARRRQAAAPAVPDPRAGRCALRGRARRSGTGRARKHRRAPTRTSCSPPPGTCRPMEIARRGPVAAHGCRTAGPGGQRRRPDGVAARRRASARHSTRPSSSTCSPPTDVVFAFHGYPRAVHQLLHGRPDPDRFHVRGFSEQGTTTTPFDMVVLNRMSRYHLVLEALRRARRDRRCRRTGRYCRASSTGTTLRPRALRGHARGARLDVVVVRPEISSSGGERRPSR